MSEKVIYFFLILILQRLQFSTQLTPDSHEKALNYHYDGEDDFTMLISGGFSTELNCIRYVVSIRTAKPTQFFGDNHYCAGVIVAARAVVTAAHCVVNSRGIKTRPRRIKVVAGTPNRLNRGNFTVEVNVEEVIPHEYYVRGVMNDIAVLRLKTPLPDGNKSIRIINLARKHVLAGENCSACGWGQLFYNGPYTDKALLTNLKVLPVSECKRAYPKYFGDGMTCAADKNSWEKSLCRGDSGSPLICSNVLHGIVSWNDNCGKGNTPSVFTDVAYYRDWIAQHSGAEEMQAISKIKLCITVMLAVALQKFCVNFSFL